MSLLNSLEEIKFCAAKIRTQGKSIVTSNGCFDIIHVGHVEYLKEAKKYGDVLMVGINSDSSVRCLKGGMRPLRPEMERALIVDSLKPVDYTFIFYENDPTAFIRIIKPDVHVKGGDYKLNIPEREVVEALGGKVIITSRINTASTTVFLNSITRRTNE